MTAFLWILGSLAAVAAVVLYLMLRAFAGAEQWSEAKRREENDEDSDRL